MARPNRLTLKISLNAPAQVSTKSGRGIPVTVLTPSHKKVQARVTAQLAADALDFYEGYLGVNYPFKKLDLMGIYDFNAGGMENIAMIHLMVSTTAYLINLPNFETIICCLNGRELFKLQK